ncbi:MAG: amidohydrolase family protein [Candidatus Acidiferrales bacterium]
MNRREFTQPTIQRPAVVTRFASVSAAILVAMLWTVTAIATPQNSSPGANGRTGADNEPSVFAIRGAKIFTLAGAPIEGGTVLIRDGKIAAVGSNVNVPADAKVIDAKGLEVYPGFFDPVTQLGLSEISAVRATNDVSELGEFDPELVAMTAVNPASAHIGVTRASGITEVLVTPGVRGFDSFGENSVIAGQASVLNLAGWTNEQMTFRASAAMVLNWPSVESSTFDFETFKVVERPYSEVKAEYEKKVYALSDLLDRARHYAQAVEKGSAQNFERDLKLEALIPVVEGKLPVLVVAESARDIRNSVEFCTKQNLKMILAGGTEAWREKDLLKQKNIPVILGPTMRLPNEEDYPYDKPMTQPSELAAAGIPIAFASFDTSFSRRLSQQAGNAVAYGLPHDEALRAVTLNAAKMLGLDDQFGTIESGKLANIFVTDGDPLEIRTQVRYLFIKGRFTSLDNRHSELYEQYRKRP